MGLYYKTFYCGNCCGYVTSKIVCHCHLLPPQSNICGQDKEPTISRVMLGAPLWQVNSLGHKYYTRVEVNRNGKLTYSNYSSKMFYRTDPQVGNLETSYKLLTIITCIEVSYRKSNEDFLSQFFALKIPQNDFKISVRILVNAECQFRGVSE